ncbi:MAG TPA: cytochrome c, partial [Polyangiaceae bacterium]|nr:cytochrome c [Polyangiaceae bacterium]
MKTRLLNWILLATVASAFSAACGDDDDSSGATGGAHQGGKTNTGGAGRGGGGHGGAQAGETSSGGVGEGGATISQGGSTVVPEGGASGASPSGGTNPGTGGTNTGGTTTASGGTNAGGTTTANGGTTTASGGTNSGGTGTGGIMMTGGAGGAEGGSGGNAAGAGGEGGVALDPVAQRGQYLVVTVAQCSSCHTDPTKATMFLGGNPNFTSGVKIPAPNLTPDVTGLGDWTDEEIKRAIRDGIDDEGRQLAPAMPYWLYHNLTDADADAIVAYLRTIPKISNAVGTTNPAATAVTPLSP